MPVGYEVPEKPAAEGGGVADFGFSFPGDSSYYNTGSLGDFWGHGMPEEIEVDAAFIERGRERYNISCAICHGESGNGQGVVSKYGLANIANFYAAPFSDPADPMFRNDGDMFSTITNGKGLMGSYGSNITVKDRWAIIAYIRTLQKSAAANSGDDAPAPATAAAKPE